MKFLERNLEDIIFNYKEDCCERGLWECFPSEHSRLFRQVPLGKYGTADLIAIEVRAHMPAFDLGVKINRTIIVYIIECKLNQIDVKAYLQAKRYKTALKELAKQYNLKNTQVEYRTVLVGNSIDHASDFEYQLNDDHNCIVYTYSYKPDGIQFQERGYNWRVPNGISKDRAQILMPALSEFKSAVEERNREYAEDMEGYWEYRLQRAAEEAFKKQKD